MVYRSIGKVPEWTEYADTTLEFARCAIDLDKDRLLERAGRIPKIGRTAAKMCGETLRREGAYDEQRIIWLTHKYVENLVRQPLERYDSAAVKEILGSEQTLATVRSMSRGLSSEGFDQVANEYATRNEHLIVDENGLKLVDPTALFADHRFKARELKGCPFAKGERTPLHDKLFLSVVDTYVTAHSRNMPQNWTEQFKRKVRLTE